MQEHPEKIEQMRKIVNDCVSMAERTWGWSIDDLANNAGLTGNCIRYILDETTRFPYFQTIQCITEAVGYHLLVVKGGNLKLERSWKPRNVIRMTRSVGA